MCSQTPRKSIGYILYHSNATHTRAARSVPGPLIRWPPWDREAGDSIDQALGCDCERDILSSGNESTGGAQQFRPTLFEIAFAQQPDWHPIVQFRIEAGQLSLDDRNREATVATFHNVVRDLIAIIGKKLAAYIAGVKDVRALDRWARGVEPYKTRNAKRKRSSAFLPAPPRGPRC